MSDPVSNRTPETGKGNVLYLLYLAVLVLAPLPLGSNRDWAWPVMTILSILLVLGLMINTAMFLHTRSEKFTLAAFGGLLAWMIFQYVGIPGLIVPITLDPLATESDILKTVGFACFFVATIHLADSRARIQVIVYTVVMIGLLQALVGGGQQLLFDLPRARGTFPNPNHYAGYLEVALALAIGLILSKQEDPRLTSHPVLDFVAGPKGRLRVIIIIMVIGLIMSRSRMGNLGFLTGILVASGVLIVHTKAISRSTMVLLGSILILDIIILGNYFGLERLEQRFRESPDDVESRVGLYHYNLQIIGDYPLTGVGAGGYETAMQLYRDEYIRAKPTHAENDYMELLVELGVVGAAPLLVLLLLGLQQQLRHFSGDAGSFERGIAFGCFMATVCLLFHGLGDVNLQIPSNSLLMVTVLAIPFALSRVSRG